jgi:broad specificity phosphatase PhoE
VYTGPLRRTIATAQIIADEARVPDIRILHGLINLDYGAWEGLTVEEAAMYGPDAYRLYNETPLSCVCPSGERLAEAQQRMLEALQLIGSRHAGEAVAAVTHAVMIRLVLLTTMVLVGEQWRVPLGRGSITELAVDPDRISLVGDPGQAIAAGPPFTSRDPLEGAPSPDGETSPEPRAAPEARPR